MTEIQGTIGSYGIAKTLPLRKQNCKNFIKPYISRLTPVLVGQTQSNMSAPSATEAIRSSGYP